MRLPSVCDESEKTRVARDEVTFGNRLHHIDDGLLVFAAVSGCVGGAIEKPDDLILDHHWYKIEGLDSRIP
jgi:hypothetical protein